MATDSQISLGVVIRRALVGAVIGTVLLTIVGLVYPRTYTSMATILFPGARASGVAAGGQMPDAGAGTSGTPDQPSLSLMQGVLSVPQPGTSPATACLIMRSRHVSSTLIKQFQLDKEWGLSMERAMERFNERFVCTEGGAGDLWISFRYHNAERAQAVVEAAVKQLTTSVEELSLDPAGRNVKFMSDNLAQAEEDCARAEKELVAYQRSVGGTPPDGLVTTLSQTYSDLQQKLIAAEVDQRVAQANVRTATGLGEQMIRAAMDPKSSGDALLASLYKTVVERESELELLRQQYTDKRPEVVKAKQALEVAKTSLRAEMNRQLAGLHSGASPYIIDMSADAMAARAKVDGLRKATGQVKQQLQALPEAQVKYGQLQLNLRDSRTRLTLVRGEFVKAQLIAQSRGPQFVILDKPNRPLKANEYETIYFALFGALLGLGLVLIKELFGRARTAMKSMGF
ncbi:MAG: GumC family protein [Armatimonadota bacterium]